MLTRRTFLRGALAAAPFALLWRRTAFAAGYGALIPDPNPEKILDLPEGFSYRIIDRVGQDMSDGYRVPGNPDGMGCFTLPDGKLCLMRNHELTFFDGGKSALKPGQRAPAENYRAGQHGAVTRVVLDPVTYQRVSSNLVLIGTNRNCQGGPCPEGWLTAEEPQVFPGTDHGWVFVCPATADGVQTPRRIDGYGRFNHEAAWVDLDTGICYLTEDDGNGCFYRFKPQDPRQPYVGRLQALKVVGRDRFDTSTGVRIGDSWDIEWVDIQDPARNPRDQGRNQGAAIVSRGEGVWAGDGQVWFSATDGGPASKGQIFKLAPDGDGGTLTLMAQSTGEDVLGKPDCIALTPWGDLFMCEDGDGDQHVRILHTDGTLSTFARNAKDQVEVTGVCFSPDGRAMFLSLFGAGVTVVITGPFRNDPPPPDAGVPGTPDAGVPGTPDAGTGPRPDGGQPGADAGDGGGDPPGGCQAGGASTLGTAAVVAGAVALLRDRERTSE